MSPSRGSTEDTSSPSLAEAGAFRDPWAALTRLTPARIALGRSGAGLPTREVLRFGLAHAQARDAIHDKVDAEALDRQLRQLGLASLQVRSRAPSRAVYLRRPDLGRRLHEEDGPVLAAAAGPFDLAIVIADGLSATAIDRHASRFLTSLRPFLSRAGYRLSPVTVATQARVALGDEIGEQLQAKAVLVLVGERPGLSSPDSLGIYLTFAPRIGRSDAERNCISNVRPEGLPYEEAAKKLAWLLGEAFRREITSVQLKDESDLLPDRTVLRLD